MSKRKFLMLTAVATTVIALAATSAQADLLFYEGFDYAAGSNLAGLGPPPGGSGTWFDDSSGPHMTVRANGAPVNQLWTGIPSGGFPQTGGFLEGQRTDDNSGHILLDSSVTATFQDGNTTWMSFVAGPTLVEGMNDNHHKPNLAIGQGELMDNRAQQANGQAIGGGAQFNTQNLSATYWDDEDSSGNFEEHRSASTKGRISPQQLIVMKIEWGATSDTVSVANFDISVPYTALTEADFDAASPVSIASANNLDQSTFDTLSFHGSRSNFDEIRIGTTFEDVVTGTSVVSFLEITETEGSTVVLEKNPTEFDEFTVALTEEPETDVIITVNPGLGDPNFPNAGDIKLGGAAGPGLPITLQTFTTANWATPQTVTVYAVDDTDPEGQEIAALSMYADNDDPNMSGLVGRINVTIVDNDVADVLIDIDDGVEVNEEGPTSDSYTVVLAFAPMADVEVTLGGDGSDPGDPNLPALLTEITVNGKARETLTFTSDNWDTPQTVTVAAVDDGELETDPHSATITHIVSSDDLGYDGLAVLNVNAIILENECGAWGFNPMDFDEDCYVGLKDFARFAAEWLKCTRPQGPGCTKP